MWKGNCNKIIKFNLFTKLKLSDMVQKYINITVVC